MNHHINDIIKTIPTADSLWDGEHKIPWNDPAFSARILREHLSQDHHLASRKTRIIEAQLQWIRDRYLAIGPASILDLGCGPGLYSKLAADEGHIYLGMDFSPASIEYAQENYAQPGRRAFRLGNVTEDGFGGPHDLVMMLYGELNVFSPSHCQLILAKAYASLRPGGRLLVEFQNPATVQETGQGPRSWTRADQGGLFSDDPYVCLTESHWFADEAVALQCFHVLETDQREPVTYRSTTKAWTREEMAGLLREAGFTAVEEHGDWPLPDDGLILVSAMKG